MEPNIRLCVKLMIVLSIEVNFDVIYNHGLDFNIFSASPFTSNQLAFTINGLSQN